MLAMFILRLYACCKNFRTFCYNGFRDYSDPPTLADYERGRDPLIQTFCVARAHGWQIAIDAQYSC